MGGLVARRAAQLAEKDILGVVHGVQPVGGAPVVYRRFRAGTETKGPSDALGAFAAKVLGWSAADITCVMANSPGPLELLPTKHYPSGWLRFERHSGERKETLMPPLPTPGGDPYEEIYSVRVQDKWWGMVDEALINPAKLAKRDGENGIDRYNDAITAAYDFHENLELNFHPCTYAYYGSDRWEVSYGAVHWISDGALSEKIRSNLISCSAKSWTYLGECVLADGSEEVKMALPRASKPESNVSENAGDGTVPRGSGSLLTRGGEAIKAVFEMKGFDHQFSYKDSTAQSAVTYSIGRLVQLAKSIKDLPQSKGVPWSEPSSSCSQESA